MTLDALLFVGTLFTVLTLSMGVLHGMFSKSEYGDSVRGVTLVTLAIMLLTTIGLAFRVFA